MAPGGEDSVKTTEAAAYITAWLRGRCDAAGRKGFVVGVSGGVDSAVTSALCAQTGKAVMAISMPICQARDQVTLAEKHLQWLKSRYDNVTIMTLDLTPALQAFEAILPHDIQDGLAMANTRSRIRMITLYAAAGHHQLLVAGTGNKIEDYGVGFFTKYGDGGVDLSPIADLVKSEIYIVARHLGISESIIKAPPTDGLWEDDRTDETQIGATYSELEWAMQFENASPGGDEKGLSDRQKEALAIYRRLHQANRHKTDPIPVCKIPPALR